jgi:F0F1-type ATP synthase assembly protein I
MANLKAVVEQLKEQNGVLTSVNENISAMLKGQIQESLDNQRKAGDEEEEKREARKSRIKDRDKPTPKSFSGGFVAGAGLGGLLDGFKNALGGTAGGLGIGALLGMGAGRLFMPALGALLGVKYLDKWVDPIIDKITGDDATWSMFGKQIDASKIVSGFAGGLALIFGPKLISTAVSSLLSGGGRGPNSNGPGLRKTFLSRLGIGGIAIAVADSVGDFAKTLTGSKDFADTVSNAMAATGVGFMVGGPVGALVAAGAYIAYESVSAIAAWMKGKGDRMKQKQLEELDKLQLDVDRLIQEGKDEAAGEVAKSMIASQRSFMSGIFQGQLAADEASYFADKSRTAFEGAKAAGDTSAMAAATELEADVLGRSDVGYDEGLDQFRRLTNQLIESGADATAAATQIAVSASSIGGAFTDAAEAANDLAAKNIILEGERTHRIQQAGRRIGRSRFGDAEARVGTTQEVFLRDLLRRASTEANAERLAGIVSPMDSPFGAAVTLSDAAAMFAVEYKKISNEQALENYYKNNPEAAEKSVLNLFSGILNNMGLRAYKNSQDSSPNLMPATDSRETNFDILDSFGALAAAGKSAPIVVNEGDIITNNNNAGTSMPKPAPKSAVDAVATTKQMIRGFAGAHNKWMMD